MTVNVPGVEFDYVIKGYFDNWNISIHHWLKNYIFIRVVRSRPNYTVMASLLTFMVSAIWHGFYPGYYHFFLMAGLIDLVYKTGKNTYVLF